ncbi:MAG: CRTAC1 family protein [Planctomycetota bacterium]|nr:MAG: CRTAC1 family protein [Planctomycetota bacterium]REK30473.1 MAG: CRTAC1 family protein [Planctomycetota bacterium]
MRTVESTRRRRMSTVRTLCGLLALAVASCGCRGGQSHPASEDGAAGRNDSHQRMLDLLDDIKQRVPEENTELGVAHLKEAESEYAALSQNALPQRRLQLMLVTGNHYLRLGRTQEAVSRLTDAYDLLRQSGTAVDPQLREVVLFKLALAHLRSAENENCIRCCNKDSCVFPIQGEGVHENREGSEQAVVYLKQLLDANPDHLPARWLLNVASMTLNQYPDEVPARFVIPPQEFESEEPFPRFYNIAPKLGLDTISLAGGAIVDDFDGDGWLDVVVSTWDPAGQLRYFRNAGDGKFDEQTDEAGLTGIYGGLNMVHADYDNDGDYDILVLRGGWLLSGGPFPNSLLQNDGRGRFRDVTFDVGLGDRHFPTQTAAWADYDNDGDLDLFVGNERARSQLFRQEDGIFTDATQEAGIHNVQIAKGVVWGDYDGDRFPDLYISNMSGSNRLYHNNRDGTFTDVASQLGVTGPRMSFPVWFWDFNNDGALDLFVSSYWMGVQYVAADYLGIRSPAEPLCLYQGDGAGGFRETAAEMNLTRFAQPMGCNFGDLDNDGWLDFYLGTGYTEYEGLMPNLMFHNQEGRRFADVTTAGGFGHLQKGHGVAFADIDHDGDQDVFAEMGGWFPGDAFSNILFENPGFDNHWIEIKLVGRESNACAIGVRIRADIEENGGERSIYRWVNSGGSFGGNPLRQHIGLGDAERISQLEIHWPMTGVTQEFRDVPVDRRVEIVEGADAIRELD